MGKRNGRALNEANNYQDKAEVREYEKGERAGQQKMESQKKRKNYKNDWKKKRTVNPEKKINSVEWYTPNGVLLKNVANITFGRRTGRPIRLSGSNLASAPRSTITVPGVLSYYIFPTFGPQPAQVPTSPLNVADSTLFSYIRHANAGAGNYESNDLGLYILAVGDLVSYYSFLVRIYGVATNFETMNMYTPEALIRSMQVDVEDIQQNYADFREGINLLAYKMQSLVIPKGISLIDRRVFLYENVFTDSENAKAQYYIYNPVGFYQYSEGTSTIAGSLTFKPLRATTAGSSTGLLTYKQLLQYGDELLAPILGSQDFNEYIAGDILKAFGSNGLYVVPSVAETYQVRPMYNKEILMQIENATIYNGNLSVFSDENYVADNSVYPRLTQKVQINSSTLEFQGSIPLFPLHDSQTEPSALVQQNLNFNNILINFHESDVSPEDVMIATRLTSGQVEFDKMFQLKNNQYTTLHNVNSCGSEIVINALLWYYTYPSADVNNNSISLTNTTVSRYVFEGVTTGYNGNNINIVLGRLAALSKFDWHPISQMITYDNTGSTPVGPTYVSDAFIDLDNFHVLSIDDLYNLHEIAVIGEFTCKNMGSFGTK